MPSFANVTIMGHLGGEPELRVLPKGTSVLSFSIAVNDGRKEAEHTTWYRCSIWGNRAEQVAEWRIPKGALLVVSGSLSGREYTKKDGSAGSEMDVRVDQLTRVDRREAADGVVAGGGSFDYGDAPF